MYWCTASTDPLSAGLSDGMVAGSSKIPEIREIQHQKQVKSRY
jgi:hypothetical protein